MSARSASTASRRRRLAVLLDRHRLAGQRRLVDAQVARRAGGAGRPAPCRRPGEHEVAGDDLGGRQPQLLAGAHDRGLGRHRAAQRLDGGDRLGLLEVADDGVQQDDAEDDAGVDPLLEKQGDDAETSRMSTSGSANCMRKRRSALGPLGGVSALRPNCARRCSTAKRSRPSRAVGLEEVDDLRVGKRVPVLVVEKLDGALQDAAGRCPEMIPEHRPVRCPGGRAPLTPARPPSLVVDRLQDVDPRRPPRRQDGGDHADDHGHDQEDDELAAGDRRR